MAEKVTEAEVLQALRRVHDPDLRRDIVSLGFIKNLAIKDSRVSFDLVLTTPACPVREEMRRQAQEAVLELPGVAAVEVRASAQVRSTDAYAAGEPVPGVRNIVAVGSGKGGVGKSTVSANIALALAEAGARVGLMDGDVYGPNIPLMMGVKGQPQATSGGRILPLVGHGIKIISIGFFIPDDTPLIWRGPMLHRAVRQFLREVEWGELDYLIVDLPPGTGDVALSLVQSTPLTGAVIVVTPQEVALLDGAKAVGMFQRLGVPVLGVVENMSYFLCPHCGERTDIFGHGGGERAALRWRIPFLGAVPLEGAVRVSGDAGQPIIIAAPSSPAADAFRRVAGAIAAQISILSLAPSP